MALYFVIFSYRLRREMLIILVTLFISLAAQANYYETLPIGVRAAGYRITQTAGITDNLMNGTQKSPLGPAVNLNPELLSSQSPIIKNIFNTAVAIDPAAAQSNLGAFRIDAESIVNVQSFGFGYGIRDNLTFYTQWSYYRYQVNTQYTQTNPGNTSALISALQRSGNDLYVSYADALQTLQFQGVNGAIAQAAATTFGYKPLGNWQGASISDIDLGIMWNFKKEDTWGLALTGGVVAPTGTVDDPDILQDIGSGDGQWDIFADFTGGMKLGGGWEWDNLLRFTYQLPGTREFKPLFTSNGIDTNNYNIKFKPGNKWEYRSRANFRRNRWNSLYIENEYKYQFGWSFDSSDPVINETLESQFDYSWVNNIKFGTVLSSIELFKSKEFLLPGTIELFVQTPLFGHNTPDVTRFEVEFRIYF
jgi:hypothetical protein